MPVKQREIMDTFLGTVNSMRDKKIDAWMRERIPSMKYIPKFFLKYFMKYAVKIEVKQHDAGEFFYIYLFGKRKGVLRLENIDFDLQFNTKTGEVYFTTK